MREELRILGFSKSDIVYALRCREPVYGVGQASGTGCDKSCEPRGEMGAETRRQGSGGGERCASMTELLYAR